MTLQGHYTARRFPERAMIHLIIECSGESEETTTHEVSITCTTLQEILEALCPREEDRTVKPSAAVSKISASHIHASKDTTGNVSDRPRVHTAIVTFYAIFCDFNELQKFAYKLDTYDNARLSNVSWYLTDATTHDIGAESRKGALRDAVMKAKEYAEVIDLKEIEVEPVELKEIEYEPLNSEAFSQRPIYRHSSGVDLTPKDIVISCAVEVYFELARRGSMWYE
ncbi:Protein of unknown function DUF541 [Penicillium expansum]|uniref:Uncharacterized protein n=1 Tax=Penicillium expansum TaxID=27334 RepID=A0A0A2JTM6_PENEN|nr:Protein of unknown function DUF541 [Penicillium expansum]KGO55580.1 Protein of unknown function DUF541 [Penicillium expansum]